MPIKEKLWTGWLEEFSTQMMEKIGANLKEKGYSWRERCGIPTGRDRHRERLEKEARDKKLNNQAKAEYEKELIEKGLVCEDFKNGKFCHECENPKNCINDLEFLIVVQKKRSDET